jgi:hypothetical protein
MNEIRKKFHIIRVGTEAMRGASDGASLSGLLTGTRDADHGRNSTKAEAIAS